MKTRNLIAVVILLMGGSLSADLFAQETLKALMKKCENMENVRVSMSRSRDGATKELKRATTTIDIRDNRALADEFIAAFDKDRAQADREVEERENGKRTLNCRFGDVSYWLEDKGNGSLSISVTER
jgi:hypothetical protein